MKNHRYLAIEAHWLGLFGPFIVVAQLYLGAMCLVLPVYDMTYQLVVLNADWRQSLIDTCKKTPNCTSVTFEQGWSFGPVPGRTWQWPGGGQTYVDVHVKGQANQVIASLASSLAEGTRQVTFREGKAGGAK